MAFTNPGWLWSASPGYRESKGLQGGLLFLKCSAYRFAGLFAYDRKVSLRARGIVQAQGSGHLISQFTPLTRPSIFESRKEGVGA